MNYRQAKPSDSDEILELSRGELGWSSSREHLCEVFDRYPSVVASNSRGLCGFAYGNALSSDILRISNLLVASDQRGKGIGKNLLSRLENEARQTGFTTILFPEDYAWFEPAGLRWIEDQGYRAIYEGDRSRLIIKETD